MRRVDTHRVSVWVALAKPANVTLSIYAHSQVASAERTPLAKTTVDATRFGATLFCALPTIELAAGAHLEPGLIYDYDLAFGTRGSSESKDLGALGLLEEGTIDGHRHLPLGYAPGLLPSFVGAPRKAADLVIAHGSCRRPYAQGLDAMVALDQIIGRGREGPPAGPRPHYLFFTGDQIYSDDLSVEMLGWVNQVGVEIIGKNGDHAIERLRVELPDSTFSRTVSFPADAAHFPPGRRQRLGTRAAGLTSQDTTNHALSFGELAAHYLLSWCNVLWPKRLDDDATWKALHAERGEQVRDYLTAWRASHTNARSAWKKHRTTNASYSIPRAADVDKRVSYLDAWRLLPKMSRAVDQFATAAPADWAGSAADWQSFWTQVGATAPDPDPPATIAATSGIAASAFVGSPIDLADLAHLMTPAWYAGKHHTSLSFSYPVGAASDPPANVDDLDLTGDGVLTRLERLRTCYVALPYVRRALANVSTLMIFDDHEVTDDWTVTQAWVDAVRARALGRDVMTNGLAAYLVFQDWGNEPARYREDHPNAKALAAIGRMFVDGENMRADGPPDAVREELEKLFGFNKVTETSPETPIAERATWSFTVTAPDIAPYEIVVLDNRTRRGYDTPDDPPANLSIQSLATQLEATPPSGSEVSIIIASLPVLGYPPTEEIAQPIGNLFDGVRKSRDLTDPGHAEQTFPQVELDYLFGTLIKDPEAWTFNTRAQEALFERLA